MSAQDCIDALHDAFNFLSEDEIRDYMKQVMDKARSYEELGPQASIERAKEEMHNELLNKFLENAEQGMKNQALFTTMKGMLTKALSMRDFVRRNPRVAQNIEMAQRAMHNYLGQYFFRKLSKEAVAYLENPNNQLEIAQGWMDAINGVETNVGKEAKELGQSFKDYTDEVGNQMVQAGLLSVDDLNKNRFLKAIHDPARMMGNLRDKAKAAIHFRRVDVKAFRDRWVGYINQRLDRDKTFGGTKYETSPGVFDDEAINDFLQDAYKRITEGQDNIRMATNILTDMKQIEKQRHMFFVFKDAKAFTEYNKEYGHGNLLAALSADMNATASKVGMAKTFGTRPADMFDHLKKEQDKVDPKGGVWNHTTANTFKQVSGETNTVVSPTLAAFGSNVRQWTSGASLVMLPAQSLNDANMAASYLSRMQGENIVSGSLHYWKNVVKQFEGYWKQYTDQERKDLINSFRVMLNNHGGYMGRFAEAENMGRFTNWLSSKYYKYNGTIAHDRGMQSSAIAGAMKGLGDNMAKSFDKLPSLYQKILRQVNLNPDEWNTIRSQALKSGDKVISIDHVLDIPESDIKSLHATMPDVPLRDVRNNLYLKLFTFFDNASQNAVLRPGAYEKALMYHGTKPGTPSGEALRFIMQFKGFPLTYITRQLADGFANSDGVQGKLYWGLQQFVYTAPLSIMSTYLWYAAHGLSMPDVDKMKPQDQVAFAAQILLPSLGVLNAGFDSDNNGPNLGFSLASSPSTRVLFNALSAPLALSQWNSNKPILKQKASQDLIRALQGLIPSSNVPGASPYIKRALDQKVYKEPGQEQLYGEK